MITSHRHERARQNYDYISRSMGGRPDTKRCTSVLRSYRRR